MPNTLSTRRARRTKSRGLQGLQLEVRAQKAQRILVFNIWSPPAVQCLSPPFAEVRLIWPGPGSVAKPAFFCSIIFIFNFDHSIPRQVWRLRRRRQWWRWRRGGGGARARWGGRRRETSWTWWTSFASLLCPHQKDLDLSQTIPVTKELVSDSQTGTFTSEANCSTICFLKVSNSPNMTQNTEEASNAQFPAIEQAAFSKCDCPGDSTTALSLPVTHTCVTHFVHNHKILPPFLSITIPAGKYTLPKFNFWNDSLLCHQSLCYCLRNRCSLNFSRKELSGKRKFLLPTFI